jgi:hypothetical protein
VSHLCRIAAATASDCEPSSPEEAGGVAEVELAAAMMGARASLTQHRDAEAFIAAQQCVDVAREAFAAPGLEDRRWQGLVLATSAAAAVQHAAGEADAAGESVDAVAALLDQQARQPQGAATAAAAALPSSRDHLVAVALKQTGAFRLAQGRAAEAGALAGRAVAAAAAAAGRARGGVGPLDAPLLLQEALADAHLLAAQVSVQAKAWEAAEASLAAALAAAEALGGGALPGPHPRVALVLTQLAGVFARTGRATLAEGLYREAAKALRLSPGGAGSAAELREAHPSAGALLAWRAAQLMTALPGRGTEAAGWARVGRELYDDAPLGRALAPETVFGTLDALQGRGDPGRGVVVDLMTRRALPCGPPPAG